MTTPPAVCVECQKNPARDADEFCSDACKRRYDYLKARAGDQMMSDIFRRFRLASGEVPTSWARDDNRRIKCQMGAWECEAKLILPADAGPLDEAFWPVALEAKWECYNLTLPLCPACAALLRENSGAETGCETLADLRAGKNLPPDVIGELGKTREALAFCKSCDCCHFSDAFSLFRGRGIWIATFDNARFELADNGSITYYSCSPPANWPFHFDPKSQEWQFFYRERKIVAARVDEEDKRVPAHRGVVRAAMDFSVTRRDRRMRQRIRTKRMDETSA